MAVRAKECGESEGHAVTAWIPVLSDWARKRADFRMVFHHERA
jgi:hypothetical protein